MHQASCEYYVWDRPLADRGELPACSCMEPERRRPAPAWALAGVTPVETTCTGCGRTWKTQRDHHCAICHRHFGSLMAFDDHLAGPPQRAAQHRDPARKTVAYYRDEAGVWRQPPPPIARRASADGELAVSGAGSAPEG